MTPPQLTLAVGILPASLTSVGDNSKPLRTIYLYLQRQCHAELTSTETWCITVFPQTAPQTSVWCDRWANTYPPPWIMINASTWTFSRLPHSTLPKVQGSC